MRSVDYPSFSSAPIQGLTRRFYLNSNQRPLGHEAETLQLEQTSRLVNIVKHPYKMVRIPRELKCLKYGLKPKKSF